MSTRPNILYIFTDQQSASAMSCAGNPDVKTPNLDKLAARGIRFEHAYSAYPLCTPARAAMFSGRWPHEVGVNKNRDGIDEALRATEMGPVFRDAGYECVYGGKWHVPEISIPDGEHGFRRICPFDDEHLADRCIKFLEQPHDKPFLMVASFDNPHNICEWGREQPVAWGNVTLSPPEEWPLLPANHVPATDEPEGITTYRASHGKAGFISRYSNDDWRRRRAAYYKLVEKVDAEIGRILDSLDRTGLADNTLVVFSADHGDMNSAHQLIQKSHFYEESANVPFIVAGPGVQKGVVDSRLVHGCLDLFPTFCDAAGIDAPDGLRGESLLPLLAGDDAVNWRTHLVCESNLDQHDLRLRMVRSEQYKYVVYEWGRYREQLFDLTADPGEMVNLARHARNREILDQHRRILHDWCVMTNDSFGRHYSHPDVPFNVPGHEFEASRSE